MDKQEEQHTRRCGTMRGQACDCRVSKMVGDEVKVPEYVERMAKETQDTLNRLKDLSAFIDKGKVFPTLSALDQRMMVQQLGEMEAYAKTLSLRYCIALLTHG